KSDNIFPHFRYIHIKPPFTSFFYPFFLKFFKVSVAEFVFNTISTIRIQKYLNINVVLFFLIVCFVCYISSVYYIAVFISYLYIYRYIYIIIEWVGKLFVDMIAKLLILI